MAGISRAALQQSIVPRTAYEPLWLEGTDEIGSASAHDVLTVPAHDHICVGRPDDPIGLVRADDRGRPTESGRALLRVGPPKSRRRSDNHTHKQEWECQPHPEAIARSRPSVYRGDFDGLSPYRRNGKKVPLRGMAQVCRKALFRLPDIPL